MQPKPNVDTSNPCPNFRFGSVCMKIIYTESMSTDTGKLLIAIGAGVLLVGIIVYFFHDQLRWIGHLPGDIAIEKENFRFYFPLTTLVLANLILWGILKLWRLF
jgi:hypothetical protein